MRVTGPDETEAHAARFAAELSPGEVVLVEGELGAGKTTWVRGAARALGYGGPVTSPTFTIGQLYAGGPVEIAHLDLYRLEAVEPWLLEDYLTPERIAFVEWPKGELAGRRVLLEHAGGDQREISA
ncbi:MAG: tRNA (adenosine(37)-N6)-threonylcarbamoyltransferase complex ATPase subunit type 1 TsaE [Thermoleophilaceae bacterium]|nr:tRNA (adenosine(37)-N6)-threonylcarbamoyltransferase complex ATPase subunit type 1 TsaE [Thermoleophilaceae bacterium]